MSKQTSSFPKSPVIDYLDISKIPACGSDYEDISRLSETGINKMPHNTFNGSEYMLSSFYDSTGEFTWNISKTQDSNDFSWPNDRTGDTAEWTSVDGRSERDLMNVEQTCWDIVADLDCDPAEQNINDYSMMESTIEEEQNNISYTTRWQHFEHLLKMEEDYTKKMHYGAQNYSRPLRHHALTSEQHKILFQNVEKVGF